METLSNIESFVRSAELGSFSAAARRLNLTPGGVSKNVAKLESRLGVRLFHRSTRSLSLTEAGEHFLAEVSGGLKAIQAAVTQVSSASEHPAGTLKVAMAMAFGRYYILPLLTEFLSLYPAIKPDWRLDNRPVDLVSEGFDVAIGGGIDLAPGVVVRELAKVYLVLVSSPDYLARNFVPQTPADLYKLDALVRFSQSTHRITPWHLKTLAGEQVTIELQPRITLNDPEALCEAAVAGLGIAHVPMSHAVQYFERGDLVRVLPEWYTERGTLSLYFAAKKHMPAKTRVFIDFIVERFRAQGLAEKWSAHSKVK
jgi:DNA-binding transcriptional LysR family regulator